MATYKEIQNFVNEKHGVFIKTCWIAHVKDICGLNPRIANNRISYSERKFPCPQDKINIIKDAFRHFKMI